MQRQVQASAPRGGKIQVVRPPVARDIFARPEIAVEARQMPKRAAAVDAHQRLPARAVRRISWIDDVVIDRRCEQNNRSIC
jgi:hypothetical protein